MKNWSWGICTAPQYIIAKSIGHQNSVALKACSLRKVPLPFWREEEWKGQTTSEGCYESRYYLTFYLHLRGSWGLCPRSSWPTMYMWGLGTQWQNLGRETASMQTTQRQQGMLWWFAGEEGKERVEDRGEEMWRGKKGSTKDGLLVSRGWERTSRGKARPEAEEEARVDRGRWKEPIGHKSQGKEGRDQGPGEGKGRIRQEALEDTDAELCQMPI